MKATITKVGTLKGKPAFEYEIRDDSGELLGFDFVMGNIDREFVEQEFLPLRLEEWRNSSGSSQPREARGQRLNAD